MKPGDIVRFNDYGLKNCFGNVAFNLAQKNKTFRITYVDNESMTEPEKTYVVEVDDPDINQFLLNDRCFDIVVG